MIDNVKEFMYNSLKAIENHAYECFSDMAANIQEGGKLNTNEHTKWSNVIQAIHLYEKEKSNEA